jgi:hypothetical protein
MPSRAVWLFCVTVIVTGSFRAQTQSSSSTSNPHVSQTQRDPSTSLRAGVGHPVSTLDLGSVSGGVYRNKTFGFTCKIPAGWVLRTDEMNAEEKDSDSAGKAGTGKEANSKQQTQGGTEVEGKSRDSAVLLAAFSRPPEAHGEEVNSSIVIAAEPTATYPGLKEAAQYLEPLTEVAKAQGFTVDEEPYEIAIGTKTLVRGDFHKDVGTRVMHQSTLAMLSHGYAVSFTVIAGTEDDVEELIDALDFTAIRK